MIFGQKNAKISKTQHFQESLTKMTQRCFKILVIDEELDTLFLIKDFLNSHCNCQTEEAYDGQKALEMMLSNSNYDLIISDYRMPYIDGLQLLELFSTTTLKSKFILHTSYLDRELPPHDSRFLGVMDKHNYPVLSKLLFCKPTSLPTT